MIQRACATGELGKNRGTHGVHIRKRTRKRTNKRLRERVVVIVKPEADGKQTHEGANGECTRIVGEPNGNSRGTGWVGLDLKLGVTLAFTTHSRPDI